MAGLRKQPFIHVTWLKDYLLGDNLCKWSVWHRIFFDYEKIQSDFDSVRYNMEHTALRSEVMQRYISAGYEVIPELELKVSGEIAVLKGKIDLIALHKDNPLVIEIKTGRPRPSDKIQLMLYLWALGKSHTRFRSVRFDGLLIYKSHEIEISALEIDESFVENFKKFMREILHGEPDRRYPSKHECRFCKIGDCDERIDHEAEEADSSDYISDFF